MSKFSKKFDQYLNIYQESYQDPKFLLDIKEGSVVVFKKDVFKSDYMKNLENTSTGNRIKVMMNSDNPLIVTQLKSINPTTYGQFGSQKDNKTQNETSMIATVAEQYAPGLQSNIVEVCVSCLQLVDIGNNLPPTDQMKNKEYRETLGEKPTMNPNTFDPTVQTNASWKDHGINKL